MWPHNECLTFASRLVCNISSCSAQGAVSRKSITRVSFLRLLCTNMTPPLVDSDRPALGSSGGDDAAAVPLTLTLQSQMCEGGPLPGRERRRWQRPRWNPISPRRPGPERCSEPRPSPPPPDGRPADTHLEHISCRRKCSDQPSLQQRATFLKTQAESLFRGTVRPCHYPNRLAV